MFSEIIYPLQIDLLFFLLVCFMAEERMIDITKKWTGRRKDWGQIYSQLSVFFDDRLPG
ncbi:MAG: hypothetical protein LBK29_02245 [Oscillospiraceae bacterium]|jgi:hypothetical protein|nr:hypothetical protein [Oscillospiraceae bacterium]